MRGPNLDFSENWTFKIIKIFEMDSLSCCRCKKVIFQYIKKQN